MKQLIMGAILLLLSIRPVSAKTVALSGIPDIQIKSSMEETIRIEVDSVKKKGLRVVVTKEGDQYYWDTRDRRKVTRTTQGRFTLFIDPTGGGYIKVAPAADGKMVYMEHISQGMETFTYWGVVEHLGP